MNLKFKTWIAAARPRTLPLSIAGIIVGGGLALREGVFDGLIFSLALLTTIGFQILSNFANDYGDGVKGTDNANRIGPTRALQSGIVTDKEMKRAMIWTGFITLVIAIALISISFPNNIGYALVFFVLGILSIVAAIKYTVGKSAYGYQGLGDLFVFLFFGLLGVVGSYFLFSKHLQASAWLLGVVIGLLSAAVLNLNNMRDRDNDIKSGKHTLAAKLGVQKAKAYHCFLIFGAFIGVVWYNITHENSLNWLTLIAFIPLFLHSIRVIKNTDLKALDPELKKVALSTVGFALLYIITGLL